MTATDAIFVRARESWRPPPRLSLSDWAERHFYLSAESAAEPGRWHTLPYQRGIMDAITDPVVTRISVMKSSRIGYALALGTLLPTPTGWTTMGDVAAGDQLFGPDGHPCIVRLKSPIYLDHPCFVVRFCDGSELVADAGHRWRVESDVSLEHLSAGRFGRSGRPGPGETRTFNGLIDTVTMAQVATARRCSALAIKNAAPLAGAPAQLPVPPYTLGLWLGDGNRDTPRITQHRPDVEIADYIAEEGITPSVRYIDARYPNNATIFLDVLDEGRPVSPWATIFRIVGVLGDKHVPPVYLRASLAQRLALLRGLMDSDGSIGADGRAEFTNTNIHLAAGVYELVVSLGMKASLRGRPSQHANNLPQWRVNFKPTPAMNPFRLRRKAALVQESAKPSITFRRRVVAVERCAPVAVQCVEVDHPSSMFLAGSQMVPTHNTKCINATVGYYIHQDPCPIMVVQPTIEDAQGYSKEEIAPMLRDCPTLAGLVPEPKTRDSENTILLKRFPGGSLSLVGANSARGFRRVSRKVVIFDETDGYPPSAGTEGDQIQLGIRRTEYYWDRKIMDGSTPTIGGRSRIEQSFHAGDQRRYYVPCPHCAGMQVLVFPRFKWPKNKPELAVYICLECGAEIEHDHKRTMVQAGEWRPGPHPQFPEAPAPGPFTGHASFHIWAAYSFSPNATWGQLCTEFVDAKHKGPEVLKTFVNTVLGETWQDRGEAPEWERVYQRRESYALGSCPAGVMFLTAGVDVQKDRLVYEVVGWGRDKRSWSIDAAVLPGDTSDMKTGPWTQLEALLARSFPHAGGAQLSVAMLAIDSGFNTQTVYGWARRHPMNRVIAVKGHDAARVLIGSPSAVELTVSGRKLKRGYKVWPIASGLAKTEFYGWLGLPTPTHEEIAAVGAAAAFSPGYCSFPEYGEEYFKQVTAEQLVPRKNRKGFTTFTWELIPGRENHFLDCRVYARAAAAVAGLDRFTESDWQALERSLGQAPAPPVTSPDTPAAAPSPAAPDRAATPAKKSWLPKRSNWLKGSRT